jgi:hypothetical protein
VPAALCSDCVRFSLARLCGSSRRLPDGRPHRHAGCRASGKQARGCRIKLINRGARATRACSYHLSGWMSVGSTLLAGHSRHCRSTASAPVARPDAAPACRSTGGRDLGRRHDSKRRRDAWRWMCLHCTSMAEVMTMLHGLMRHCPNRRHGCQSVGHDAYSGIMVPHVVHLASTKHTPRFCPAFSQSLGTPSGLFCAIGCVRDRRAQAFSLGETQNVQYRGHRRVKDGKDETSVLSLGRALHCILQHCSSTHNGEGLSFSANAREGDDEETCRRPRHARVVSC